MFASADVMLEPKFLNPHFARKHINSNPVEPL